jgi:transcriptional regulator with XRE-family HTH domain
MATFKDRFKELRLEKGLTLKDMGNILDLSESNMSMYEAGKRQPKGAEDFIKIANFFGVSLDYLMGRTDEKTNIIVKNKDFEYEADKSILEAEKTKKIKDKLKEMLELLSEDEK